MSTTDTGESRPSLARPLPNLATAAFQSVPSAVSRSPSKLRDRITLGIIGGGQLAKMTAQAAAQFGCEVVILERQADFPAGWIRKPRRKPGFAPDDHSTD